MRSAFRITDNPLSTQGCSCGSSFAPKEFGQEQQQGSSDKDEKGGGSKWTKPLFGATVFTMIKDFFTYRPDFDEDPIKNKVKQAMLFRNRKQFDQAQLILQEVLEKVKADGDELPITRTYYEIAFTYFLENNYDKADEYFRLVIKRFV